MKPFIFVFLFLICQMQSVFAFIQGTIRDAETGDPVYMANVFLDKTMVGTTTNSKGFYTIANHPVGNLELVVHHIGYDVQLYNMTVQNHDTLTINFLLQAKVLEGKEIEVVASRPKEWHKNLKRFTKIFLGESSAGYHSEIINPQVLDFNYDKESGILEAKTDYIIEIKNNFLGYDIYALLDDFHWKEIQNRNSKIISDSTSSYFVTELYYQEMQSTDEKQINKWRKNRSETYKGSFRHFMASAARNNLSKDGFIILYKGYTIPPDSFKIHKTASLDLYTFDNDKVLKVVYTGTRPVQTTAFKKMSEDVRVDSYGNIYSSDPLAFVRFGKWKLVRCQLAATGLQSSKLTKGDL